LAMLERVSPHHSGLGIAGLDGVRNQGSAARTASWNCSFGQPVFSAVHAGVPPRPRTSASSSAAPSAQRRAEQHLEVWTADSIRTGAEALFSISVRPRRALRGGTHFPSALKRKRPEKFQTQHSTVCAFPSGPADVLASPSPAHPPRDGRRVRSRTKSVICATKCSGPSRA